MQLPRHRSCRGSAATAPAAAFGAPTHQATGPACCLLGSATHALLFHHPTEAPRRAADVQWPATAAGAVLPALRLPPPMQMCSVWSLPYLPLAPHETVCFMTSPLVSLVSLAPRCAALALSRAWQPSILRSPNPLVRKLSLVIDSSKRTSRAPPACPAAVPSPHPFSATHGNSLDTHTYTSKHRFSMRRDRMPPTTPCNERRRRMRQGGCTIDRMLPPRLLLHALSYYLVVLLQKSVSRLAPALSTSLRHFIFRCG